MNALSYSHFSPSNFQLNKRIPEDFTQQILTALSYFPELRNIRIEFTYASIKTTMQCRPRLSSLFSKKRKYMVLINNCIFDGILLKDIPFNAQVGIIAHELCHILDYEKKNLFGILKRGLDYCHQKTKKNFEYEIDSMVIYKGLGWQLYEWAEFSLSNSLSSNRYKAFKSKIYMQPALIMEKIQTAGVY